MKTSILKIFFAPLFIMTLSGCNLFSLVDKPSGDPQILAAARSCLDQGDFTCATDHYQKLSSSYSDIKLSEGAFAALGSAGVFQMSDLMGSLGSGQGGGTSFKYMAEQIAARGKTAASLRATIQTQYSNVSSITNSNLKAYMQFIVAFTMFSQTLASAVGADGVLSASDLVAAGSVSTCRGQSCGVGSANACSPNTLTLSSTATGGSVPDINTAAHWTASAAPIHLMVSISAANSAVSALGSGSGLFNSISNVFNSTGLATTTDGDQCTMNTVLKTIFPN